MKSSLLLQVHLQTASNFVYEMNQDDVSYRRLREAIASGELMPSERLVETGLADSLGVGRAAIRTAIARLAQERLVERIPNRGARVRRVSDDEALEVLEIRMVIESFVVRLAAQNATAEDIRKLNRILTEMEAFSKNGNTAGFGETNHAFHNELLRIARHPTSARVLESLLSHRFQLQRLTTPSDPLSRLAEHRRILAAVEAKDVEGAEREMRAHLYGVIERWRGRATAAPPRRLRKISGALRRA